MGASCQRRSQPAVVLLGTLAFLPGVAQSEEADGWVALFNGRDLTGWTYFLQVPEGVETPRMSDVWTVDAANAVLTCQGKPPGYIRTEKTYTDYVLELEWRFPAEPGNSGVLLRMTGPDQIWPRCVEAQLQSGRAGDFRLIGGAPLETEASRVNPEQPRHRRHVRPNEKPLGEWNHYRITVDGDRLALEVNGELLNQGRGAEEVAGTIGLQSEGAVIEFRNIRLKPLR
jgi:hypothetical protein